MRRAHSRPKYLVYQTWPVFIWRPCSNCGNEFRREWGWRALTDPYYGGQGVWRYLCRECAPNRSVASDFCSMKKYVSRRPAISPIPAKPNKVCPHG